MCIPFVELLSDKFRPVLYYRILFLTEVLIGFLAVQLEVLDAVMSLDEFSDYTIFIAAVITWYELYAAYLKPQPIELGIHVFLGGALYAQGPLLEAFILMAVACLFIVGSLRASRARVIATYFLICASSTLTPKVSRFGLVLTMLKNSIRSRGCDVSLSCHYQFLFGGLCDECKVACCCIVHSREFGSQTGGQFRDARLSQLFICLSIRYRA